MATRHGRLSRTPVSPRDPGILTAPPATGHPAVSPAGHEDAPRAELLRLAEGLLTEVTLRERWRRHEAMTAVLDWLDGFPGGTWQERWLLSGSDARGQAWGPPGLTPRWRNRITTGLGVLIILRAVRPAYGWLSGSRLLGVYEQFRRHNQAAAFADLAARAGERGFAEHEAEALNALTRMVIVTGKNLTELGLADVFAYVAARKQTGRTVTALPFAYELLRSIGGLSDAPPTLRQAQARGQLTVAELVDRYPVACRPVRDVLVHYLAERSAALDYGSLDNQAQILTSLFWADLERHHPGISSLHLPGDVVHDWKQRIRTLPDGRPRRTFHTVLFTVRSFYLDLLQWSLEDGTPLRFTPHDFRRVFSTETVNSGLPIHIAARLLGHLDLNTTQGYVAVYPAEVIRRYRQFTDQRREQRPSEEYREPTDTEWAEFRDHFSLRKVALGTCDPMPWALGIWAFWALRGNGHVSRYGPAASPWRYPHRPGHPGCAETGRCPAPACSWLRTCTYWCLVAPGWRPS